MQLQTTGTKSVFLVLGIDSTTLFISFIEPKGFLLDQIKIPVASKRSPLGHTEFNPHTIVSSIRSGINQLIQKHKVAIQGIGITSTGFSAMAWHKDTGATLGYAVQQDQLNNIEGLRHIHRSSLEESISKISGLHRFEEAAFLAWDWLLRHVPDVQLSKKNKSLLLGTIESWILFNLSGKQAFKTDITHALRTGLFNFSEKCWDKFLIRDFGIEPWMLPDVHPSSFEYAKTKGFLPLADGIDISAISFQTQAELLGNFGSQYGQCQLSFFEKRIELLVNTGETIISKGETCTLLSSDHLSRYGTIQTIDLPIWPKQILGEKPNMPISGDIHNHSVYMRMKKESFSKQSWDWIGITEKTSIQDLYFSYHKSIAFSIKEQIFQLEKKLGFYFKEFLVDSHTPLDLLQLYSDICEIPLVLVRQESCAAWGIWVLLCLRNEKLKLNLISKYRIYKRILPGLDPISTVALYQEWRDKIR